MAVKMSCALRSTGSEMFSTVARTESERSIEKTLQPENKYPEIRYCEVNVSDYNDYATVMS